MGSCDNRAHRAPGCVNNVHRPNAMAVSVGGVIIVKPMEFVNSAPGKHPLYPVRYLCTAMTVRIRHIHFPVLSLA